MKQIRPWDSKRMNENPTIRQCAACNQEVSQDEALYSGEVEDQALFFCSPGCQTNYLRTAAPTKEEVDARAN